MWPGDLAETVVVEEWTAPSDISKPLFFWNLNGIITALQDTLLSSRQWMAERVLSNW